MHNVAPSTVPAAPTGPTRGMVTGSGSGHPGRHDRARDPETARRLLLPRLAARATQMSRTSTDLGGRDLISAGRVDPADGEAGRTARHHPAVEVAGQRDGERPRRPG